MDFEDLRLGGGFKHFLCSSLPGEMIQFDYYFSNGLKPPPRRCCFCLACETLNCSQSKSTPREN